MGGSSSRRKVTDSTLETSSEPFAPVMGPVLGRLAVRFTVPEPSGKGTVPLNVPSGWRVRKWFTDPTITATAAWSGIGRRSTVPWNRTVPSMSIEPPALDQNG